MSDSELIELKPEFMGFHRGDYPGAFPPKVERTIRSLAESPCLHLFSGSSKIGDVRVDLTHKNATLNQDVFTFIKTDSQVWNFVIADPPYEIDRPLDYASTRSFLGDVFRQSAIAEYLRVHADNVLWFDYVSPCPKGFVREKTYLWLPGSWRKVRVLTWLKRKGERLQ